MQFVNYVMYHNMKCKNVFPVIIRWPLLNAVKNVVADNGKFCKPLYIYM